MIDYFHLMKENLEFFSNGKLKCPRAENETANYDFRIKWVFPGGPVVIILASESEVCGFDLGRGPRIFSESTNPEYDFLRKGSKAVGPVS